jgi:hypothetical protein
MEFYFTWLGGLLLLQCIQLQQLIITLPCYLSFVLGVLKRAGAMKKAPLHLPGRQGASSVDAKPVLKSTLEDFASPREGTPLLAARAPVIGSPALVRPLLETPVLLGTILPGPDSATPILASMTKFVIMGLFPVSFYPRLQDNLSIPVDPIFGF